MIFYNTSFVRVWYHILSERIKICQISEYHTCFIRNARTPYISQKEQSHLHHLATYMALLAIRQYERKSYRVFVEWLVEAYYLRIFLQYHIYYILLYCRNSQKEPVEHYQKKIVSSFITLTDIRQVFVRIDSSGLKATYASQYYTERAT